MPTYTAKISVFYPMRGEIHPRTHTVNFNAIDGDAAIDYVERSAVPRLATPMKFTAVVMSIKGHGRVPISLEPMASINGCDDCHSSPFQLAFRGGHNMRIDH